MKSIFLLVPNSAPTQYFHRWILEVYPEMVEDDLKVIHS
jgi:hypothetical protein